MNVQSNYQLWLNSPKIDAATKQELLALKNRPDEIEDRFYKDLEFGTAGLRGKLGAGTNRMNTYTVGRVTQGIADYICANGPEAMKKGVAIAYDNRHGSVEFSKQAALILAANGIVTYWFESLRPTPLLSYALRELGAVSGIIITASHNPKDYNGYKVYWDDGAQVLDTIADGMLACIQKVDLFEGVKYMNEDAAREKGLFHVLGSEMDNRYVAMVKGLSLRDDAIDKSISVVYTPLNGTGSVLVQRVLKERGFKNFTVVKEQEQPDPDFTTVEYPNPEDPKAFAYAEKLGRTIGAKLLLATDPDCDRLAIEVMDKNGDYIFFNGNQTGAILIEYLLSSMAEKELLPKNPAIVKSIVTGDLGKAIGETYGVTMFESLTGFKNICGRIPELKAKGFTYIFGYEESIGYTTGQAVRDKDAVSSAMLLCEAAAYYQAKGLSLLDVLEQLFEQHGYYMEKQIALVLEGIEGSRRIERMMVDYRQAPLTQIKDQAVVKTMDYLNGYEDIPPSDVLRYYLEDGSWYAVRPSGTEPKIKIYLYTKADTKALAEKKIQQMEQAVKTRLLDVK